MDATHPAPEHIPAPADCASHRPGHNPHWIQVRKAGEHGHQTPGALAPAAQPGAFWFTPDDPSQPPALLHNHDPQRLASALGRTKGRATWTPDYRLVRVASDNAGSTYCFDMSDEAPGPCTPRNV